MFVTNSKIEMKKAFSFLANFEIIKERIRSAWKPFA
jgi:hypothetical protein